jgi:hypothetical protein
MVSSTFTDLKEHRAALVSAIKGQGLTDVAMENDSAKPDVDVIDSSLQMVRDASANIGVISRRYGQTPLSQDRNPRQLSITELEFNEAQRLKRPILLFIMGEGHLLHEADIETDPGKREKLNAFRERAKQMKPDSPVHRVYATFDCLEEFTTKAIHAVAGLRRYLDAQDTPAPQPQTADPIPSPPAFYAEPPYIGSHQFVGRQAQLDVLSDWAVPADQDPVLLFDAIGGSGKSMLTWEWTTKYATEVRGDWAGRFWYSFYERGGIMADFCRRALAYITREPLDSFNKLKTPELGARLLRHLRDRPWLLVLDGLERVLVTYHRFDAAEVADEEANQPTDQIAQRDPCSAIRPEDDDLLRALAAATPSKLLITSRLVPSALLNSSSQAIPAVRREFLAGLRPTDAEALLRSCGVTGDSQAIQDYLTRHCDCHPLVTGALGGLITGYLPARGDFDAWAADPDGGGRLNLAELNLVQKRNHILKFALDAVPDKGRQILSILALLSEAVDYPTMSALNPHLAPDTIPDLERRGLLQYDRQTKRYDLHPVVRGIAAGGLRAEEKDGYGQRVVDYFSSRVHRPYNEAETLEDVRDGLHIVRTLLKMGRYQQAYGVYRPDLAWALTINLEAWAEVLSLLRPFFPKGWTTLPNAVGETGGSYLANAAAIALYGVDELVESSAAFGAAIAGYLLGADWRGVGAGMANISFTLHDQNRLARKERCVLSSLKLATLSGDEDKIFSALRDRFEQLAEIGQWADAKTSWENQLGYHRAHGPQLAASHLPSRRRRIRSRSIPLLAGRFERRAPRPR